jgi:hypothetical protein
MSTKIVALQENDNDAAKIFAIQETLKPLRTIYYKEGATVADSIDGVGDSVDYLLFTGGHGDFVNAAPAKLNGLKPDAVKRWLAKVDTKFDAIILDTCFSSSFVPTFAGHLEMGGAIVCAHGSGEGFTDALLNPQNKGKSVGEALGTVTNGIGDLGLSFTSLSLYVRSGQGMKLYTTNAGQQRSDGLSTRQNFGMDADSAAELGQLDGFLIGKLVAIEPVTLDGLRVKLKNHITMAI